MRPHEIASGEGERAHRQNHASGSWQNDAEMALAATRDYPKTDDNDTWKAYVDTNKDSLSAAPKFDYDKLKK